MLKNLIFATEINKINKNTLIIHYIFFSIIVAVLSYLYCNLFINRFDNLVDSNHHIILKNLQFDYGKLSHNIFYNSDFSFIGDDNVLYYLQKLLFFPILIVLLAKISSNIFFIFIAKNLILSTVLFYSILTTLKSNKTNLLLFLLLLMPFLIPYNLHVILTLAFADNIVAVLLPCIFIVLFSNDLKKYYIISIILFILYLTKSSVSFIVILLPILILFLEKDEIKYKILPLIASFIAILTWGIYGVVNTGKFPIGSSLLSYNTKAIYENVLNDEFRKYYPLKSVDLIIKDSMPKELKGDHSMPINEWDLYDYFKLKNKNYLKYNFKNFIKDIPIKIKFIFFGFRKDSVHPENGIFKNPILFSYIVNKLFFNLAIIVSITILLKKISSLREFKKQKMEIYLIFIISLSLIPLIVGWATGKHLVAIQIISMIYLIFNIYKFFGKKINLL